MYISSECTSEPTVHTSTDKGIDINNKKAKFFLNLEYWLSDQIYTQAAEKQELKV
tara:strand:- start:267 stop:431 length:165 start_codon:yes stop_codon:yes gene_type:complete